MEHLPKRIQEKALEIINKLNSTSYEKLKGKRLSSNRNIVTIPIGKKYRMILKINGASLQCLEIVSHSDYDKKIRSRKLENKN